MAITTLEGLGEQIKAATDLLQFVMKRAQMLFADLDRLLVSTRRWEPGGGTLFFSSYSTTLESLDQRLPAGVGKLYVESTQDDRTQSAIVVEVHLSPTCGASEALLVLGCADFDSLVGVSDVANDYDAGNFVESLLQGPPAPGQRHRFGPSKHREIFGKASQLHVAAWPLVQITGPESLRQTILAAISEWEHETRTAVTPVGSPRSPARPPKRPTVKP